MFDVRFPRPPRHCLVDEHSVTEAAERQENHSNR
jgi:hypothetical protein